MNCQNKCLFERAMEKINCAPKISGCCCCYGPTGPTDT